MTNIAVDNLRPSDTLKRDDVYAEIDRVRAALTDIPSLTPGMVLDILTSNLKHL